MTIQALSSLLAALVMLLGSTAPSPATVSANAKNAISPSNSPTIDTRTALVNIFCTTHDSSVSGSGVIISSSGVILTNAHIAQYVLLSEESSFGIQCNIRTKSPTREYQTARVIYIPPAWVLAHAADIQQTQPISTGEHDYAFLQIDAPSPVPYVSLDTTGVDIVPGTPISASAYPAELLTPSQVSQELYAITTTGTIGQRYSFGTSTADVFSIGETFLAQSGSSGGMVLDQYGSLIGIITTISDAQNVPREARALSLVYIDRDLNKNLGFGIANLIAQAATTRASYESNELPKILAQYRSIFHLQ